MHGQTDIIRERLGPRIPGYPVSGRARRVVRVEHEPRPSQACCEPHRMHRAAVRLARYQHARGRMRGLQAIAPDQRPARDRRIRQVFRENRAPAVADAPGQVRVLGRIGARKPAAHIGRRRCPGRKGALVRGGIDPECQAADHGALEPRREIARESRGRGRRGPRADDRDAARRNRSLHGQERRRVPQIQQAGRILRFAERDHARVERFQQLEAFARRFADAARGDMRFRSRSIRATLRRRRARGRASAGRRPEGGRPPADTRSRVLRLASGRIFGRDLPDDRLVDVGAALARKPLRLLPQLLVDRNADEERHALERQLGERLGFVGPAR